MRSSAELRSGLVAVLLALAPLGAGATYSDVTGAANLTYVQHPHPQICLYDMHPDPGQGYCAPERMSGGAAARDYDGDGDIDLYVTTLGSPNILFRNKGDNTFEDVTTAAGLDPNIPGNGAGWGDVDNDGDPDLLVTTIADTRYYLFINDGNGVFTEEGVARGASLSGPESHSGYGVAFGDYDRDGWLDVHLGEWRPDFTANGNPSRSRLLRNRGAAQPGYFDDVTDSAGVDLDGIHPTGVHSFSPSFVDLDGDGWQELAIASDFSGSRLFWNDGDGTFTDGTVAAGVGTDENGMGSTFGDYDGDGRLDWFVTSIYDPNETCTGGGCGWGHTGNRLYRNDGARLFSDETDTEDVRNGYWGWGASFYDHDNDGDLDLVHTNGFGVSGFPLFDQWWNDPMRFWRNDGTSPMVESSAAELLTDTGSGRGLLTFDYDDDGDLDVFLVNNGTGGILYENLSGNPSDSIKVRTVGVATNRDGFGARLHVQPLVAGPVQLREIGAGVHFLAQSPLRAHFGLGPGASPVASVRVEWPRSGMANVYESLARDSTLVATETSCGDQTGDGGTDAADVTAIQLCQTGLQVCAPLCDADGDDACGPSDVTAVGTHLSGADWAVCLP